VAHPLNAGMRLPVELKFPDDTRNITAPLLKEFTGLLLERRWIDAGETGLAGKRIEFVGLQATITDVLVRVQSLDGAHTTTLVHPSQPWVEIAPSQGIAGVAAAYLMHGFEHIMFGTDHLLFVLGLMLMVRDRWMLLKTITAFTLAHSITLAAATLGYVHVPSPPLEAGIALSIMFVGVEVLRSWQGWLFGANLRIVMSSINSAVDQIDAANRTPATKAKMAERILRAASDGITDRLTLTAIAVADGMQPAD
jgi:hypothetical protein